MDTRDRAREVEISLKAIQILCTTDSIHLKDIGEISDSQRLFAIDYMRFEIERLLGCSPVETGDMRDADDLMNDAHIMKHVHESLNAGKRADAVHKAIESGVDPLTAIFTRGFEHGGNN